MYDEKMEAKEAMGWKMGRPQLEGMLASWPRSCLEESWEWPLWKVLSSPELLWDIFTKLEHIQM